MTEEVFDLEPWEVKVMLEDYLEKRRCSKHSTDVVRRGTVELKHDLVENVFYVKATKRGTE